MSVKVRVVRIVYHKCIVGVCIVDVRECCRNCQVVVRQSNIKGWCWWWRCVGCRISIGLCSVYFNNIVESCVRRFGLGKSETGFSIRQSVCLEYRTVVSFQGNRKRIVRVRNAGDTHRQREFVRRERSCIGRGWSQSSRV